jgi:hypothetical protein
MCDRLALAVVLALAAPARADVLVHGELDPLTFANGGYGGQLGVRLPSHLRLAVASFALDVPDLLAQFPDNDGFHLRVRPSGAVYALYYLAPPGHDGLALGGSMRYLRLRYTYGSEHTDVAELSPEAIVGYQWHPLHGRFYLQPWLALGVVLTHDHDPVVTGHRYDELPVSPFFTVNIGYEYAM